MAIVTGIEANERLTKGALAVVRAIETAFGPYGRAVMFHRPPAPPEMIHDGYTIAREMCWNRGIEALGAQTVKETLFDIDRDIGDGTSMAAIMIGVLLKTGIPVTQSGADPGRLAEEILRIGRGVTADLMKWADGRGTEAWLTAAARTAAQDENVAEVVAGCGKQVGAEGVIRVEEGHRTDIDCSVTSGMAVRVTPVSAALSDERHRVRIELDQPFVLVADEDIDAFGKIAPVLEGFARSGKALLIVARNVTGDALTALLRNKAELGLHVGAVRVAEVGERGYELLEDVAVATGAQVVSERLGTTVQRLRPPMLGKADAARIEAALTTIVGGRGGADAIERRRTELRHAIDRQKYLSLDREILQERLARLCGGVARISVGAPTASARKILMMRAKKAAAAAQWARRFGVLPGGAAALLRAAATLNGRAAADLESRAARQMTRRALRAVPTQLLLNAGLDPAPWLARMEHGGSVQKGLNLVRREVVDLVDAQIVDPAWVVATAVERAFSAAATLLRSGAAISR
jgi:chaperonin GroEL